MESETKRMIIAMSGHSVSHNTNIAKNLASFLKSPFINEVDIFQALQKSLPSASYRKFALILDVVSQISSTQINLNLNVVINMELSRRAHYDRLVKLASSTRATLIIIHCKTEKDQGGEDYHGGDFGFGHVPTVIIDATKPFIAEVFVPKILQAAEEKKNVDLSTYNPEGAHSSGHDKRDIGDMHAHDFELSQEPKKENLSCTKCEKLITSGPTYHCVECDDFVLHQECAESPKLLVPTAYSRTLMSEAPEQYDFLSRRGGCHFCHEFRSSCPDCLLRATIKAEYLPAIRKDRQHEHPLNFVIMPFSLNYQYKCFACDEMGKHVGYKCFQCNYNVHTRCRYMYQHRKWLNQQPEGASSDSHSSDHDKRDIGEMHAHEFEFSQEPKKENLSCTKCEKPITSGPTYHCVECDDFVLHKACAESPEWYLVDEYRCRTLLSAAPQEYYFSSSIGGCKFCHELRYSCPDCLLRATIKGEYLPAICEYGHEHPLHLVIMPFSLNYQYRCFACDEMGKHVGYKCFQCNYALHTLCPVYYNSFK